MIATVETPRKLSELDKFLVEQVRMSPNGLRLHQFVLMALDHGFRGQERGELTQKINRTLKRLVRDGVIHRKTEEVEFVA